MLHGDILLTMTAEAAEVSAVHLQDAADIARGRLPGARS